jgi:hypothetical protein
MIQPLSVELASRIGIRTALVAQCLWDLCAGRCPAETSVFDVRDVRDNMLPDQSGSR